MSGGVLALNRFPDQFEKLKANPDLIPNMNSEIIRWQTPLAYMRRIATRNTVLNGQFIRKGDKVVMWYASGNRDERVFDRPDDFIIDRANVRNHISFGFGVHRCMGNGWPNCNCGFSGRNCSLASRTSRSSANLNMCSPTS